ncbi:MAG: hypothetical protein IKG69_09810 [Atopobiaceae bacterium]|nr:hypothetical protein [Atopobiaceae bacterium]
MNWEYVRLKEDGTIEHCPTYDYDGSITGKIVVNVKAYFDENPSERIRLGWTKHLKLNKDEIREQVGDWNRQTQYLTRTTKQVDEWTIEDVYHVHDKSEQMLLLEEIAETSDSWGMGTGGFVFFGGEEM